MSGAELARVPAGYAADRERGAEIVALPSVMPVVRAAVAEAGTLHEWASRRPGARAFTGRGAAYAVTTPAGEIVVRHYRRGGAVARVLDDRYLRSGVLRPLVELRASMRARSRGVQTPEVVAACVYGDAVFYRADLATRLVPDAADLAATVLGPDRVDAAAREAAWRSAGALLRAAFAAGVLHRDLNMRNILVQRGTHEAWLLDLDRARIDDAAAGDVLVRNMVARLHRSRRKLESMYGETTSHAELAAFEEALGG